MRLLARVSLSLLVVGAACSHPIDPKTADLSGNVQTIDPSGNRLGINSGRVQCVTAPCVDYSVHVTGKVFRETGEGTFEQIPFSAIPNGSMVFVWTTGVVLESFPGQVEGRQVVVRDVEGGTRKSRAIR